MLSASWKSIAEDVRGRIESGELAAGARLASEEELAEKYGVSRHTAHRALSELQRQGLLVRQRRWGTVVAARNRRRTGRIGFLVDYSYGVFQADLMRAIENALAEDASLIISDSKNDPLREATQLLRMRDEVDGIVCYPTGGTDNVPLFQELVDAGFPIVFVDRAPAGLEAHAVLTDHEAGARRATQELVDRGHSRIAFFGGDNDHVQSVRERRAGYLSVIDYDPRPYSRSIVLDLEHRPELMIQAVYDAVAAMRMLPEPPTAAFCVQDCFTVSLLEACSQQGLRIPEDLEVAGFNDFRPVMLRFPSRLHRVVQRADDIGRVAVERLYAQIDGLEVPVGPERIPTDFYPAVLPNGNLSTSMTAGSVTSPADGYQRR
ncbi:MAG: GntR family transcriptional regulator [Fimbriimonas sp.]